MDQRGKDFSDLAVENAILDLKKIQLKKFDNESLTKLSPTDSRNNNFLEEDDNNNLDNNANSGSAADGFQPSSRMRMAVNGNDVMTASCSESESEDPLELIDRLSANGSGDEGTWLYSSPGSRGVSSLSSQLTPAKNGRLEESPDNPQFGKRRSKASPLDWLRRDFDQTPSPEVEKARHSLVNKVDEITQGGKPALYAGVQMRRPVGRLDSQTFRIRDSRNQARKSLQELINFSGPHQATSTQTSSHECQTEEAGMQTSFLDETLLNMSPGSTLTLPRSVARNNKRHSLQNPSSINALQSDPSETINQSVPQKYPLGTPSSSYSTPLNPRIPATESLPLGSTNATSHSPVSLPPGSSSDAMGHSPGFLPPGRSSIATGHSPGSLPPGPSDATHSDNGVDNEIYYEALEYPLIEPSDRGNISKQEKEVKKEEKEEEEESDLGSGFNRTPRYQTFTRKNAAPLRSKLEKRNVHPSPYPALNECAEPSPSPRMNNTPFDKLSTVEIDIDSAASDVTTVKSANGKTRAPSAADFPLRTKGNVQNLTHGQSDAVEDDVNGFANEGRDPSDNADGDVMHLVVDVKSRTFTRPKKAAQPVSDATRESEQEESKPTNNAKAANNAKNPPGDSSSDVVNNNINFGELSVSSTEEGGYDDDADSPHLPARVDSSTFTRPMKKNNLKNKKINRNPLRLAGKTEEEADDLVNVHEGTKAEEDMPQLSLPKDEFIDGEDSDGADGLNNNKPKIVGSATVTRSAGRRLKPKLQLNESLQENGPSDSDSRTSSPRSSLPLGEDSRSSRKASAESQPDSRPGSRKNSRSSPVVWDQSNFDKPADMVDVQVIARMQEDSLRRSIVSNRGSEKPKLTGIVQPLTAQNGHGRNGLERNSSLPSPYSKQGGNHRRNGATNVDDGYSAKPRIGREDSASSMHSMDSNPGAGGNPSGSDSLSAHSGTPPDSPLGGSRSDLQSSSSRGGLGSSPAAGRGRRGGGSVPPPSSVTRRSLPNLAAQSSGLATPKAKPAPLSSIRNPQPSLKSHTSDSNLRDKTGLRQPTSRLKPPTSNLRTPSPASNAANTNRSVSPGGIPRGIVSPTPRSIPSRGGSSIARPTRGGSSSIKPAGIPRGGGANQPAQIRRSGIQVRGAPNNVSQDWEEDYY